MRIETNKKLIDRNTKWAFRAFFITFALILGSLFLFGSPIMALTGLDDATATIIAVVIPSILLPVSFIATRFSMRLTNLWTRPPRPEKTLGESLKGIGRTAVLYNYYHFPARHVLITPAGVIAMTTRWQDGRYTIENDVWRSNKSIFGRIIEFMQASNIGAPSLEAQEAAQHVDKLLADINPDVPVYGVMLLNDPRAEFTVSNSNIPVLYITAGRFPNLRQWVKDLPKAEVQLTPEQIARFEEKTLPKN